jgi:hypothetical protein
VFLFVGLLARNTNRWLPQEGNLYVPEEGPFSGVIKTTPNNVEAREKTKDE